MPNVPKVPGVPALSNYNLDPPALVVADAVNVINYFLAPSWGIYQQGLPVIVASTIEFDFDQEWTIADYPQEQGAFQSYDKVQLPFECRVRLACGGPSSQRQAFLNSIFAISGGSPLGSSSLITTALSAASSALGLGSLSSLGSSLTGGILSGALAPPLFDLVTPEGTYSSCSVRRVSFGRKSYEGATLIVADLIFIQIRVTSTSSFTNTQIPGLSGQQSSGNVQPQTPTTTFPSGNLM